MFFVWWALLLLGSAFRAVKGMEHAVTVSAYYKMDSKRGKANESDAAYFKIFEHTLKINSHCIFFYDTNDSYTKLHAIRNDSFRTTWVQRNASLFMTHGRVPSLASIWLEKVHMVYLASQIVDAEWYAWVDAGIVPYRLDDPPAVRWPETNLTTKYPPNQVIYHNFRGKYAIAGTAYLVPANLVNIFRHLFYAHVEICLLRHPPHSATATACHDDQVLLSFVFAHSPEFFYNDPIQGLNWGALVTENYLTRHQVEAAGCMIWTGHDLVWCP
jgi:hypothetical protein